jgi:hypothetical protein
LLQESELHGAGSGGSGAATGSGSASNKTKAPDPAVRHEILISVRSLRALFLDDTGVIWGAHSTFESSRRIQ